MAIKYGRARLSGHLRSTGAVSALLRTELHRVLMPLARAHLGAAAEGAARGEPPLGNVAAFVLLSHCALNSFLWSTWQDRPDARPHKVAEMIGKAEEDGKPAPISFHDFLKAVGRGVDGKQPVRSKDLDGIKAYVDVRNKLLQHSPQKFAGAGSQTPVRAKLTVAYGEQVWKHLENAIRAISSKYGLEASWLDRR
jgi:hypothetical protein